MAFVNEFQDLLVVMYCNMLMDQVEDHRVYLVPQRLVDIHPVDDTRSTSSMDEQGHATLIIHNYPW